MLGLSTSTAVNSTQLTYALKSAGDTSTTEPMVLVEHVRPLSDPIMRARKEGERTGRQQKRRNFIVPHEVHGIPTGTKGTGAFTSSHPQAC